MTRSTTTTSSVNSREGPVLSRGRAGPCLETNLLTRTFYFSSSKVEDVPNKTNHDVSGVREAENNTKPSGEHDPDITIGKMIYFIESPAPTKEPLEDSARTESGNTSQDQSKISGEIKLVRLTIPSLQRT